MDKRTCLLSWDFGVFENILKNKESLENAEFSGHIAFSIFDSDYHLLN